MRKILLLVLIVLTFTPAFAQESAVSKGLALTPPMGWNSWNKFGCNVSDELVRGMADAMVKSGMKDADYQYIVIDDCWQVSRDAHGNIVADPQRFPQGIKALADYVHSVGLKFGIYSDAGAKTCEKRPGGLGHEYQDALMYAAWGVDYFEVRLVQHASRPGRAGFLREHSPGARCQRPPDRLEHLRMGYRQAMALGKR